jgi:hypothetical protein
MEQRPARPLAIMAAVIVMTRVRTLFGSGRFWSGILCAATFSRASAFIERPPRTDAITSGAIESFWSYNTWGILLLISAVGMVVAHADKRLLNAGVIGHLFGLWAYATFGIATVISAVFFGQTWATAGTYMSQALLHAACAIYLGTEVSHHRKRRELE